MKKIRVGFSQCNSIYSKTIRSLTGSEISHCYFIKDVEVAGQKDVAVYHADGTNVHQLDYDAFKAKNKVIDEIELEVTEGHYEEGERLLYEALGKPYSYKEILGFGWILINKAFGRTTTNPLGDGDKGFFCSALVARYLGYPSAQAERMSPVDVYTACQTRAAMQTFMRQSQACWATAKVPQPTL